MNVKTKIDWKENIAGTACLQDMVDVLSKIAPDKITEDDLREAMDACFRRAMGPIKTRIISSWNEVLYEANRIYRENINKGEFENNGK